MININFLKLEHLFQILFKVKKKISTIGQMIKT